MDGTPDDNFSLSSIFSQSYFEIPDYQRDYAWEASNVNDLFDDIEFVYTQEEGSGSDRVDHYFGTLVLENRGNVEPTDYQEYDKYGIVDGQQRLATVAIVISAVIDEMEFIKQSEETDEQFQSTVEERQEDIRHSYIKYEGIEKIQLGGLAEDAYDRVVLGDTSPSTYLNEEQLVETERKVARAKKTILDRLQDWKMKEYDDGSINYAEYYKFLNRVIQIVTQRFEVNVKVVEDVDEAARMFKVINDRGRDLRLHDQVRSHLVYCASQSEELDSEEIYRSFNTIVRNITVHDGFSDSEVDNLINIHWTVFTSERSDTRAKRPGPSEIHRRLSDIEDFANVQRDDFENFIEPYLSSLESFSELYPYLTDRDMFAKEYYEHSDPPGALLNKSVHRIQLLFMHAGSQSAVTPLLFAVADRFGIESSEFFEVTDELEKLVFRYNLVMSRGTQPYMSLLASIANDLYWAGIDPEKISKVFNSDRERYIGYQSKELGIKNVVESIIEKREDLTDIGQIASDYLDTPDVINGEGTSGWGGVRSNEVIKYIMYEYECSRRSRSGLLTLSPYHDFRNNFQVEHLVPRNAEEGHKLENHEENKNRLGNLAVLSDKENQSEGNASFRSKYDKIYSDSSLKLLNELEGPDFSVENISDRTETLLGFIRGRW